MAWYRHNHPGGRHVFALIARRAGGCAGVAAFRVKTEEEFIGATIPYRARTASLPMRLSRRGSPQTDDFGSLIPVLTLDGSTNCADRRFVAMNPYHN